MRKIIDDVSPVINFPAQLISSSRFGCEFHEENRNKIPATTDNCDM